MKDNTTERDTQGMAITSQVKATSTKNKQSYIREWNLIQRMLAQQCIADKRGQ